MIDEKERLKKRIEDQQHLQDQERERKKPKANEKMDADAPDRVESYDFWCDVCQEDFSASCYKSRHRVEGNTISIYRTTCSGCDTDCIRHITHKDQDLYYYKSAKIRKQRNKYANDVLQDDDYGFNTRYGNPYTEFNKKMIEKEQRILKEEKDKGFSGQSLKSKERLRRLYAKN